MTLGLKRECNHGRAQFAKFGRTCQLRDGVMIVMLGWISRMALTLMMCLSETIQFSTSSLPENSHEFSILPRKNFFSHRMVILNTQDGCVFAVDLNSNVLWNITAIAWPMASSKLKFDFGDGSRVVSSTDGNLYVIRKEKIIFRLDEDTLPGFEKESMPNGEFLSTSMETFTLGINPLNGKIYYFCDRSGCNKFYDSASYNEVSTNNVMILRRTHKTFTASKLATGESLWSRSYGQVELSISQRFTNDRQWAEDQLKNLVSEFSYDPSDLSFSRLSSGKQTWTMRLNSSLYSVWMYMYDPENDSNEVLRKIPIHSIISRRFKNVVDQFSVPFHSNVFPHDSSVPRGGIFKNRIRGKMLDRELQCAGFVLIDYRGSSPYLQHYNLSHSKSACFGYKVIILGSEKTDISSKSVTIKSFLPNLDSNTKVEFWGLANVPQKPNQLDEYTNIVDSVALSKRSDISQDTHLHSSHELSKNIAHLENSKFSTNGVCITFRIYGLSNRRKLFLYKTIYFPPGTSDTLDHNDVEIILSSFWKEILTILVLCSLVVSLLLRFLKRIPIIRQSFNVCISVIENLLLSILPEKFANKLITIIIKNKLSKFIQYDSTIPIVNYDILNDGGDPDPMIAIMDKGKKGIATEETEISSIKNEKNKLTNGIKSAIDANNKNESHTLSNPPSSNSRIVQEFEDFSLAGKGGFGRVIRCRHKFDKCYYALKCVVLPNCRDASDKVQREVHALAKLNHSGVVRYFTAWFEQLSENSNLALQQIDCVPSSDEASESIEWECSDKCSYNNSVPSSNYNRSAHNFSCKNLKNCQFSNGDVPSKSLNSPNDGNEFFFSPFHKFNDTCELDDMLMFVDSNGNDGPILKSNDLSKRKSITHEKVIASCDNKYNECNHEYRQVLIIQMELCPKGTLLNWLNDHQQRDYSECFKIFKELVVTIEYIHSQGLVHRDLKPSNILFSENNRPKIGDFGLVAFLTQGNSSNPTTLENSENLHQENISSDSLSDSSYEERIIQSPTSDVGTQLYMSPEQHDGRPYDSKVDIYALGLIFFELLLPFNTCMERIKSIEMIKKHELPNHEMVNIHPKQSFDLIHWMLRRKNKKRPRAVEILQSDLFQNLEKLMSFKSQLNPGAV